MFPGDAPALLGSKLLASIFHPELRPTMGHTLKQGTPRLMLSWLLVLAGIVCLASADFPPPSITDLGNTSTDIKRILCLTSGGFPKPHLSWLENGEELNTAYTMVSQDRQTELFTVNSSLDFNTTSSHVFKCLVKYGD